MQVRVQKTLEGSKGPMVLDVSFSIEPAGVLAIMGPSGAGKTSILRLIAGLMRPDAGEIRFGETCWYHHEKRIFRSPQERNIGYVFQDYALFPHMSVYQNLKFALPADRPRSQVDELLEIMGLANLRHRRPAQLSGGQQQRAALARALVRRPPLLLLDEPLSALDQDIRCQLQEALLHAQRSWKGRMILVSHDAAEVAKVADQLIWLEDGRIRQQGPPAALLAPKLQEYLEGEVVQIAPEEGWMGVLVGRVVLRLAYVEGLAKGDHVRLPWTKVNKMSD